MPSSHAFSTQDSPFAQRLRAVLHVTERAWGVRPAWLAPLPIAY
jgi:hypothetical protein